MEAEISYHIRPVGKGTLPQGRESEGCGSEAEPEVLEGAEMPQRQGFLHGTVDRECEPVRKPPA